MGLFMNLLLKRQDLKFITFPLQLSQYLLLCMFYVVIPLCLLPLYYLLQHHILFKLQANLDLRFLWMSAAIAIRRVIGSIHVLTGVSQRFRKVFLDHLPHLGHHSTIHIKDQVTRKQIGTSRRVGDLYILEDLHIPSSSSSTSCPECHLFILVRSPPLSFYGILG
ncbi:uncharacterized protein LOC130786782 [Actinidia eriantha]|uniref:uncharacterized protein LOC130774879 n=1 Tax=Actinidia eriantha TaxID=165200 RepID=UPI00258B585E|nr:uncharacterized protein LOC130774879 [Actinidia eriantha]XP_057503132.1 uncharacterized protein LOC130786782 [Actinidia eriantha]